MTEPLTLDAAGAAELLGWHLKHGKKAGQPYADLVRSLYRKGRFPAPIDPVLPVRQWRWSRRQVVAYAEHGPELEAS